MSSEDTNVQSIPLRRENFVGAAVHLSRLETLQAKDPERLREHVVRQLRDLLADAIARHKIEYRALEHGESEYRLEVIVLTPSELNRIVDERAEWLARAMPRPLTWVDYQPEGMNDADPRRAG